MLSLLSRSIAGCAAAAALFVASASAQTTTQPLTSDQILKALDRQMLEVVLLYDAIKGTPILNLTPQDARQQFSALDAAKIIARGVGNENSAMPVGQVLDGITITGLDGNQIPIRVYYPAGSGPFPVTVYFHGGGFVVATIDTYDSSARALCNYSNSIVVSVEYRKAPEFRSPAALRDALAAYQWAVNAANSGKYNAVYGKVAVAGESAGANLATEVAMFARDQQMQMPTHQLLIYPVVSGNLNQQSDLLYTSSMLPLYTPELPYFSGYYQSGNANNAIVVPINGNATGLPPATIIAAELDPLRSDGEAYRDKLIAAKVPTAYMLYPGTTHEFFGMGSVVDKAKAAEQYAGSRLAASFQ